MDAARANHTSVVDLLVNKFQVLFYVHSPYLIVLVCVHDITNIWLYIG